MKWMDIKIPKTPIKMIEVKPGMFVADPSQKLEYYAEGEIPDVFKPKNKCKHCDKPL